MKSHAIYIISFLLIITACTQNITQNNIPQISKLTVVMPTANTPQTKIDTINVGNILEGETIQTNFYLKNNNTTPLVIASTVTGCGCTRLKYNTTPIMPGDSTLFTITFDSKNRFGTQLKDIDIIAADHQIAKIIMRGTVTDNN